MMEPVDAPPRIELDTVLEALPAIVLLVDGKTRIIESHRSETRILPGSHEKLVGTKFVDHLPDAAASVVLDAIDDASMSGLHQERILELQTPQGTGWFEMNVSVAEDPEGSGEQYVILLRDVSERTRIEQDLKDSERRYRTLFDATGTATFLMEDDFTITLVNEEFEKLTGFSREEVIGKMKGTDFLLPAYDSMAKRYHAIRKTDPSSVPKKYEVKGKNRRGDIRDGFVTVEMMPATSRRVVSYVDTTELKRVERLMYRSEKMAALGQLITGVAHEINNPNHFIYVNIPVLKEYIQALEAVVDRVAESDPDMELMSLPYQDFKADLSRILESIQLGSERITRIVGELKTHATVSDDERKSPGSIVDVVEKVETLVGKQIKKEVRELSYEVDPDLPVVTMDAGRIEQVIANLLINASHAADKQERSWIRLTARRSAQDPRYLELSVQDNGSGIPAEVREKIFEPYFTTKDRERGTGLGLWVCHRIVEDHCGTIQVESVEGEGSTFVIEIPFTPPGGPCGA